METSSPSSLPPLNAELRGQGRKKPNKHKKEGCAPDTVGARARTPIQPGGGQAAPTGSWSLEGQRHGEHPQLSVNP